MAKNKIDNYKILSKVGFAVLLAVMCFTSSCGGTGVSTTVPNSSGKLPVVPPGTTPGTPALSSIAAAVAIIATTPYLTNSTFRYLSDCQIGNTIQPATGCVQGSDTAYDGTSPTINGTRGPWQTLTKGAAWLNSQTSGNNTLALLQGGVWNVPVSPANSQLISLAANRYCAASQTCSEVREWPLLGSAGIKPVIYGPNQTGSQLFFPGNGQRFMNLTLIGTTPAAGTSSAFFLYSYASLVHDVSILNVDISGFDLGILDATYLNNNITIVGNHFSNNYSDGYLGGSNNLNLNYNSFIDNGGEIGTLALHSIYVASHEAITGVNVIGNYVTGYYRGLGATQCTSGQFVMHGAITNLVVSGNAIINDANAAAGCWGLSANLITAAPYGGYFRNALFSNNVIVNGGNSALNVEGCPYCVIENNLIIADNPTATDGISAPPVAARTSIAGCTSSSTVQCYDDPSTNYTIRNNTVYFTANAKGGMIGIQVGVAGSSETQTGHKVYNNTVTYMATTASSQVFCFDFPLAASAYTTISNNNCYVPNSGSLHYAWEQTTGKSLAAWQASTTFDTNSSLSNPGFALKSPPYISWSDGTLAANLFNTSPNIFSPSPALSGKGISGPSTDITGAPRSTTTPSIGAYE